MFANCDRGLPICIEVAVLVASETFMSLVENVKEEVSCVNGDDRGCDGNGGGTNSSAFSDGGDDCKGEGDR